MKILSNFEISIWFASADIKLIQFLLKQQIIMLYKHIILFSIFRLLGNIFIEDYWNLLRKWDKNILNIFCLFLVWIRIYIYSADHSKCCKISVYREEFDKFKFDMVTLDKNKQTKKPKTNFQTSRLLWQC